LAVTGAALPEGEPVPGEAAEDPEGLVHPQAQPKQLVTLPGEPFSLDWVLPIEHFSASQLYMFETCPRQWQQRYILGRKEPPGQALVLGSVTHGGIEHGLDIKMLTGDDPKLDDVLALYHDMVWPGAMDRYGGENEVIWDSKPEVIRAKGAELVTLYHPRISLLEPESIEHEFLIDIGLPVPIKGFIDLVQANGRPTIDFKTSGQKRSDLKPDWLIQGRIYQLVVPRTIDIHQITTQASPQLVTPLENDLMSRPYSERLAEETKKRIRYALAEANHLYSTLGPDEDWPMRGVYSGWKCDPKWCGYRKDCPAWLE
jgi:hypothetical protein